MPSNPTHDHIIAQARITSTFAVISGALTLPIPYLPLITHSILPTFAEEEESIPTMGVNIYVSEMENEVEDRCLCGLAQSIPTMGVNISVSEMENGAEDQCLRGLAQSIPTME